jgi:RHS repeat-associated protein
MAGQYFDAETGLHYNYFRDYDPSVGRYVQSDLIGLLGGLNTYIYAANSPATFRDQYGLLDADGHGLSRQIANGINGALDGISEALKGRGMGSQAAPEFPLWEADGEQSHPDRIDEGVARNCPGDADCGTIGWSIDVLQRQLRFRRWDMQHHGGGDAGHIGFYETLRAELLQLIDLAKSKPCPYNPKADIEVTLPWNYPTPMF